MVGTRYATAGARAGAGLALSACALGGSDPEAAGTDGEPTPAAFAEPGSGVPPSQAPEGPPDLPVNPFAPAALNNLAIEHAERGDLGKAQELLERAAKLDPDNEDIAANLADIRQMRESLASPGPSSGGASASQTPGYADYDDDGKYGDPESRGAGMMPPPPPRW